MDIRIQAINKENSKTDVPQIRPGYRVAVHQRVKEGKRERVQIFEGMVLALNGGDGVNQTITVRKTASGVGVEKVFPIHNPVIEKIEVKRAHKVRQAKLNFLKTLSGKSARLKEVPVKPAK